MHPDAGRVWFRVAVLIIVASLGLLFIVEPGTAEFVVSVLSLAIGVIFVVVIAILARRGG